jgi:hypothetical protein
MKKNLSLLLGIVMVLSAASAQADIWGVKAVDGKNEIININPLTGAVSKSYDAPNWVTGNTEIGLAGWGKELFYTNTNAANDTIYRIDPTNGATLGSYTVAAGWEIDGLGYWSGASGSYIYTSGCSVGDVHRYDATNGSFPTYYWSDISNPLSMAGDNGGKIFTAGTGANGLFGIWQIDPEVDGTATWFAGSPATSIVGMAYDGINLFLSDAQNMLYTMDNSGNLVSSLDLGYTLWGLGSTEGTGGVVPEPGTFLLLGVGLGGLVLWRRKQRS